MLGRIRAHLTYANVMATLAFFIAAGGGTAWAVNEWTGANIVDGSLTTADYKNNDIRSGDIRNFSLGNGDFLDGSVDSRVVTDNSLTGADIANNQLDDQDIAQGTFVNFNANIGTVAAHSCVDLPITGVGNSPNDHVLLTADYSSSQVGMIYSIKRTVDVYVTACNPTDTSINDGTTKLSLLLINGD
jgi:hypothetical protein